MRRAAVLTGRDARSASRRFLADGPQTVREALELPDCVVEVFVSTGALARHHDLVQRALSASAEVHVCNEQAIDALSGSRAPQGIVAVCRFVDVPLAAALAARPLLAVVAAHVREPGNAGALIRCADAAGAGLVVLGGSSVDPYNDKAVRATAGSLFHQQVVVAPSVAATIEALHREGFTVLAADAAGATSLETMLADGLLRGRVAWLFGNESWGIPAEELAAADRVVAVPIFGKAESLNVATAAAVCLYATVWAQRMGGDGSGSLSCS